MNEALVSAYGIAVCGFALGIGSLIDRWGAVTLCAFIFINDI